MSFLHDDEVFYNLLSALVKKGQVVGPDLNIAKKLVSKLSKDMSSDPNISAQGPAALKINNLQNMDTFVQFLYANKINIDGMPLVLTPQEWEVKDAAFKDKYLPLDIKTDKDEDANKFNQAKFYYNKDLLPDYVVYLQEKAKRDNNKVLEVIMAKLIGQFNLSTGSNLAPKLKDAPVSAAKLLPNDVLDNIEKNFDINKPISNGTFSLQVKDLQSMQTLDTWLRQAPPAQVYQPQKNSKYLKNVYPIPYTDKNANKCIVLNALYLRAKSAADKNPKDAKAYFFLQQLKKIGPEFTSPDGKACAISGSVEDANGYSYTSMTGEDDPSNKGKSNVGKVDPNIFNQMVQALPFNINYINFNEIKTFFRLYEQLLATSNSSRKDAVQTAMQQARSYMNAANNCTVQVQPSFSTSMTYKEIVQFLKPPQGNYYLNFLSYLRGTLSNTFVVVDSFYLDYLPTMFKNNPEQRAEIEGQVLGENSIYMNNLRKINRWEADRDKVVKIIK